MLSHYSTNRKLTLVYVTLNESRVRKHRSRLTGMQVAGESPASKSGTLPTFKPYRWRQGSTYPASLRQKLELELAIAGED